MGIVLASRLTVSYELRGLRSIRLSTTKQRTLEVERKYIAVPRIFS